MVDEITVEICYAREDKQFSYKLVLRQGTTIAEAINQSGVLDECPEINLEENKVGVFSEFRSLNDEVDDGDRVEIYRPLIADPKESRRKRAKEK